MALAPLNDGREIGRVRDGRVYPSSFFVQLLAGLGGSVTRVEQASQTPVVSATYTQAKAGFVQAQYSTAKSATIKAEY